VSNRDILAIGASAGGVDALRFLASQFPPGLPAAVVVTIHLPSQFRSALDAILTQNGPLPATFADDGETLEHGRIYLGPPGCHLLVDEDRIHLGTGPRENNARPAIDPMFRSAALCCGHRTVGVVLTGTLGDGAAGVHAIQQCGGLIVVQDPSDAAHPEMPTAALNRVKPDHIVALEGMPMLLEELIQRPAGTPARVPESLKYEVEIAKTGRSGMSNMDRIGKRSVLACPDCHGVMWELDEGELVRYRCHVGHAYTAELMALAIDENLTRALGSALRALDERIALARKLQKQAEDSGRAQAAETWALKAEEQQREAEVIRDSIRRADEISARFARP